MRSPAAPGMGPPGGPPQPARDGHAGIVAMPQPARRAAAATPTSAAILARPQRLRCGATHGNCRQQLQAATPNRNGNCEKGNRIMATRKTTSKPGPWKAAATDLLDAARSLGKAVASKAEQAQAQATTALTKARKDASARGRKIGQEVSASVQSAEARLEETAKRAKQSVQRTLGSAETKAQAARTRTEGKLKAAGQASSRRTATAGDALAKEARAVQAKAKQQVDAIATSIKRAAAKAKAQAAGVSAKAAREAGAAKRAAAAATKSAVRKTPVKPAARKTTRGQ